MALWFDLRIGTERLGTVEIRRQEPFDLADPAINEQWFTYTVRRDGRLVGRVRHYYAHGAWALLELASSLLAEDDRANGALSDPGRLPMGTVSGTHRPAEAMNR